MSTIIDCGNGRYIAGEPVSVLAEGQHWCGYCGDSGLDRDWDDEFTLCTACDGSGATDCPEQPCSTCVQEQRDQRCQRLLPLWGLMLDVGRRANVREDWEAAGRAVDRVIVISAAYDELLEP